MGFKPLYKELEELPDSGLTVTVLNALDWIVPGEWENVTSFEEMITKTTDEDDEDVVQAIGEKAMELYSDSNEGYQRAVQIFSMVDSIDKVAGAAALANKVGSKFSFLGVLEKFTPKADTTQTIDAAVKFVAELAAFCYCNGIPGDSVGDFASSLIAYGKEDIMRIAAWVALDCAIPLGPDFLQKMMSSIQSISSGELSNNSMFQKIASYLPGNSLDAKRELIATNLSSSGDFLNNFATERGVEQQTVYDRIMPYLETADNSLDYVAAILDIYTNYYEHTGIQTVARRVITRAYQEL
jgi:hypothetical protein